MSLPNMSATQAWLSLIALSVSSTLLAFFGATGVFAGLVILGLAWIKAQVILRVYLGLQDAPSWGRGFALVLAIYMIGIMGLAIAAG
ncbi:cytochrome C oxidase subunit IV family protein [uncultured Pelagimonas sp.]|uniref:cytochrome C oxidase subunit IV family protein n=1 Tax=uncultured Pelagimonas sp. TaxID=1618102 RepID=UPI002611ED54|nr:cytochrome C oxidase subunit IV family protein [uncultured Pelagimonas sp.]